MKPNGRRVWRRYSKEYRRGFHLKWIFASEDWKLGNGQAVSCAWSGAYRRRHSGRNNGHHIGKLRGFEPRPFTARSLVGMTMGARKRAARNSVKRSGLKPYMLYEEYRIGERLRPCPGCFDCAVECWVCHEPHDPPDELCGGSGVIRAG